jgi:50S ribosomal protein L16 3-hydroxylase
MKCKQDPRWRKVLVSRNRKSPKHWLMRQATESRQQPKSAFTQRFANEMNPKLLGGITATKFLRDYWQKKPLLIRQAFDDFTGVVEREALFALACRDDVESRIVKYQQSEWRVSHGPFTNNVFTKARKRDWTLLVQDLNHCIPEAEELLQQFDFIPHARLDDLMVSYAAAGGGVGAHTDSYDVFLLQGPGKRRWRISAQKDTEILPNAPLKILKDFIPENEWVLESGDMLYLPPGYAHEGVALTECMTYSIGFRAPSAQELATAFLGHMQEQVSLHGRYNDPDLTAAKHPGDIPKSMLKKVAAILQEINWNEIDVATFLGAYLSEPKPHVFFSPPERPWSKRKFASAAERHGLRLALKSRMLYRLNVFFLNGERFNASKTNEPLLKMLADKRSIPSGKSIGDQTLTILWEWYCAGFVEPINPDQKTKPFQYE